MTLGQREQRLDLVRLELKQVGETVRLCRPQAGEFIVLKDVCGGGGSGDGDGSGPGDGVGVGVRGSACGGRGGVGVEHAEAVCVRLANVGADVKGTERFKREDGAQQGARRLAPDGRGLPVAQCFEASWEILGEQRTAHHLR